MDRSGKKLVSVTCFTRGADGIGNIDAHYEGKMTKQEMLKRVENWWDCNGTHLDDYEGIQLRIMFDGETDDR